MKGQSIFWFSKYVFTQCKLILDTVGTINAIGNDNYGLAGLVDGVTGDKDDPSRRSTSIYELHLLPEKTAFTPEERRRPKNMVVKALRDGHSVWVAENIHCEGLRDD
jgi:hypothetical protein